MNLYYNNKLDTISDYLYNHNKLEHITKLIYDDFALMPVIGVEIEFFISHIPYQQIIELKNQNFALKDLVIKKERGKNQYEIIIPKTQDVVLIPSIIDKALQNLRKIFGANITLQSNIQDDEYGNGMHFHVNFTDFFGENIFAKKSNITLAARSLCHYMEETFWLFAPHKEQYFRYKKKLAPTHISWGNNNRTVAVRIPDTYPSRLEHRIASSDTNPLIAIFIILQSIYLGMKHPLQIHSFPKIFGNAFDEQYNLTPLPNSPFKAAQKFNEDFFKI